MDVSQVSNEELLAEIERQAAGEVPAFDYGSEWLRRLGAKKLKLEQFDEALAKGYAKCWPTYVRRFQSGELFGCQWFDFTSMLMATEAEVETDQKTWTIVQQTAMATDNAGSDAFKDMAVFAASRVAMPFKRRAALIQTGSGGLYKPSLSKETLDSIESARKRFDALRDERKWWWATSSPPEREKLKEQYGTAAG